MGSIDGDEYEQPLHQVTLSPYCIDRTEVTVAGYATCVNGQGCQVPSTESNCNYGVPGRENHPVNCVDWSRARRYCELQAKRLPTEAQWEFAARGPQQRKYPWGFEVPTDARLQWSGGCGQQACAGGTAVVGAHPTGATPDGIQDMSGNVSEYVLDRFSEYRAGRASDPLVRMRGTQDLPATRGGNWLDSDPGRVSATARSDSDGANPDFGFRCARALSR